MSGGARTLFILLLAIALLPGGCTPEPQAPLRIGTNVWPGYEPLYLARDLGYFPINSVKMVEYHSASEVMRSFQNRAIDAAALTLDEAVQLAATGSELKVVLVLDVSHGGDAVLARSGTIGMRGLRNKRIGVEATALGAYMLTRALQTAGMKAADVSVVSLEISEHERAFTDGRVDAVVTFDPVRTRLLAAGAQTIFDSSQIPGEVVDVLVVRSVVAAKDAARLSNVLEGWFRALEYLKTNQGHAVGLMAKRESVAPDKFLSSLKGLRYPSRLENRNLLAGAPPALLSSARRLAAVMLEHRLIAQSPDLTAILDGNCYLEGAP